MTYEFATWYVRGSDDTHDYDREAPLLREFRGQSFCRTCLVVHPDPVGNDWHIESEDVDTMLCGLIIELDDGAVRLRPARNVCPRCLAAKAGLKELVPHG